MICQSLGSYIIPVMYCKNLQQKKSEIMWIVVDSKYALQENLQLV